MRNSLLIASLAVVLPAVAAAQSVGLMHGAGQGLMFSFRGNCYAIMPDHILGGEFDLSLDAGTADKGSGRVFRSLAPGLDLAIGHIDDTFNGHCQQRFEDLPARTDAILERQRDVDIVRVYGTGGITREPATVRSFDSDYLVIELDPKASLLFQGTSGAMVYAGDTPIAMAVEAIDSTHAKALRMDAILERITRILDGREAVPPEPVRSALPEGAVPYRLANCSGEPLDPAKSCAALAAGTGPAVFPAGTRGLAIELDLTDAAGGARKVRGIDLVSRPVEAVETAPRKVTVTISPSGETRGLWTTLGAGDMAVTGRFSAEKAQPQNARRLRVVVTDAWDENLPVRIDSLTLR